jgi:hypothetical protein
VENSVKKRARSSEARLPVLGIFHPFLASEMQPVALSLWFVSLSAMRKRNEQDAARPPCEREMNKTPNGKRAPPTKKRKLSCVLLFKRRTE